MGRPPDEETQQAIEDTRARRKKIGLERQQKSGQKSEPKQSDKSQSKSGDE